MKNLKFSYNGLKKQYKNLLDNHPCLEGIMIKEFKLLDNVVDIVSINNELYGSKIIVNDHDEEVIVAIDFVTKKIHILKENVPYKKVYFDWNNKYEALEGYAYQNGERRIFRKHFNPANKVLKNCYTLVLKEQDKIYNILLETDENNFDINAFTNKLLNDEKIILNLHDLLVIINEHMDISPFALKLSDNVGNMIKIVYGNLVDYVEYRDSEDDNENERVFMRNGELIVEKRIREKGDAEVTSFMKKIGVYNGKEKR